MELPPQRFSRPSQSTALPPILNCFYAGLSTCGFVRLAHLAVLLTTRSRVAVLTLATLTCMQDRRNRPRLPPILNCFSRRSFNLRFCSLGAPGGAAHHSFARGWALFYIIFYETQSQKLPRQQKIVCQTTTDPWSIPNWLKNQSGHLARGTVHRIF